MELNAFYENAAAKRNKAVKRGAIFFLAVMLLLTFFSNTINNFTLPKVRCETPSRGVLIKQVSGTGKVQAMNVFDLYVSTNMKVTEVFVSVGDAVKKGQAILALDTSEIEKQLKNEKDRYAQKQLNLEKLEKNISPETQLSLDKAVEVASQNLDKAQNNYDYSKSVFDAGYISKKDLNNAETELKNAKLDYQIAVNNKEKTINDAKRDIETTKLDLSIQERTLEDLAEKMNMSTVTSPCEGVVTELGFSKGMTATASQPLYIVSDLSGGFQFKASVDSDSAQYLKAGDACTVYLSTVKNKTIQGKVSQISESQQNIGSKKDVIIDISPEGLIGGEIGTADIKKNIGNYSTLVSNSALGQDSNGYFVYVLRERKGPLGNEFYVQKATVSIGESDNSKTAVLSGITAADKVVSASDKFLSDGGRVMQADGG